jgi:NTP pyrophosphatase (non-canonical NTP hydrolase)
MTNDKSHDAAGSLEALRDSLRQFAVDRDWSQFHTPKNLAIAMTVEVAELLEQFQWLREGSLAELGPARLADVRLELADVLVYLVMLADRLDVDLLQAARDKLKQNAEKYPVDKARGTSRKYTEL